MARNQSTIVAKEEIRVPQSVYLNWVKKELDSENACLELPMTIILLISFSALAIMHLQQPIVFSVEQAIEQDILENANFAFELPFGNKNLFDAHSFADIWSWVRLGFLPLVIQPAWSYSERYTEDSANLFQTAVAPDETWKFQGLGADAKQIPVTGDYLHYNRIIGGLRFQQQVATASDANCRFPSGDRAVWQEWYGKPCTPAWEELSFKPDSMDSEEFSQPERVEWIPVGMMSLDEMRQKVVDMEDGCAQLESKGRSGTGCLCAWCAKQSPPSPWLREDTQRMEISMATYNAEYGLISLTGVNIFFNRGGEMQKRVEMMSSWMDPFNAPWGQVIPMVFCDLVWVSLLSYIVFGEVKEIVSVIRAGEGPRWWNSLNDDYWSFWNIVDWITIVVALVVVWLFVMLMLSSSEMHAAFQDLIQAEVANMEVTFTGYNATASASHLVLVEVFFERLQTVTSWEKQFRLQLCLYPMMVMLRLFKSFAAQARLAVVTDTLSVAAQDLVHFFIVFLSVFFCITLSSVLFFGQDSEDFSTMVRATHTCFRIMFGDWDWDSMQQVRRSVAMLWFSGFNMMMVLILLNMLLAIIMENYMKVKEKMGDAPSLSKQMQEMWRRRQQYKAGKRVRLNDIYDAFLELHEGNEKDMLRSDRILTPRFLLDTVKDLQQTQAERTMGNALAELKKATTKEFELQDLKAKSTDDDGKDIPSPLERLDDVSRKVRDGLLYIQDRVGYYDTVIMEPGLHKDASGAMARAAAATAQNSTDSAVSGEVLDSVSAEVGRLNYETASILGQTVRRVDLRQRNIESRQADMEASVREMHQTLLNLQTEASSVANRLLRLNYETSKAPSASAWRRNGMPAFLATCAPDAQEGSMPSLPG